MPRSKTRSPKPKQAIRHGPLAETEREDSNPKRYAVSVESCRARKIDTDNLCAKYFVDALRYAGIIPDDRPEDIEYSISQKKVKTKAEEITIIEVREI